MKGNRPAGIVLMIAAMHVGALSFVFGLRHIGYLLGATLSATLIWGAGFLLDEQKRRRSIFAGIVVALALQQVAYQAWKGELPGFGWPLAQFGAVHCLIALGIGEATK